MRSEWAAGAARVIQPILARELGRGTPRQEIIKQIDAAYPFGERDYWPYKAWLRVRKDAIKVIDAQRGPVLLTLHKAD